MTESGYLKTMLTALGGDPSKLPDNLESTCYKAIIELLLNGGGGSGGGGNSEYKQPEWGYKEVYVLPETEVTLAVNEDLSLTVGLISPTTPFIAGQTYTVNYNGVNYNSEMNGIFLGNGVLFGLEDTGEPFAIAVEEGQSLLLPIDQQPGTVKISITGKAIKPIENVYAPEVPVFDLKEWGMPEIKNDEVAQVQWDAIDFDAKIKPLLQKGIVKIRADLRIDWKNQFTGNKNTGQFEDYCFFAYVTFVPNGGYGCYFAYALVHDVIVVFEFGVEEAKAIVKSMSFISA